MRCHTTIVYVIKSFGYSIVAQGRFCDLCVYQNVSYDYCFGSAPISELQPQLPSAFLFLILLIVR